MGVLSIREFNANLSKAIARAKAGENIEITSKGEVVAELGPPRNKSRSDNPAWLRAMEGLRAIREQGVAMGGPATYEERTGR